MLTVPEAARRAGRNPETIRRWIRERKLRASKVGTQHVIDEVELDRLLAEKGSDDVLPAPDEWAQTFWGGPMPNVVEAIRRSREGR
jgi:excisionase family DNA binding protein